MIGDRLSGQGVELGIGISEKILIKRGIGR